MLAHKFNAMQQTSDENFMLSLWDLLFPFIFDFCHFTKKYSEISQL